MQLDKIYKDAIQEIKDRSKGWPVGIYIEKDIAKFLVENKLAEYAVPSYPLANDNVLSIRLTILGDIHELDEWGDCEHENIINHICQRCGGECHSHEFWDSKEGKKRLKQLS